MKARYAALLFWLIATSALAQPIRWDGQWDYLMIGNRLDVLEDPSGRLTLAQVSSRAFKNRFTPSDKIILNFGFTESIHWLRFSLDNPTQDSLLLEVAHAFLPTTDLFYREATGRVIHLRAGYQIPVNEKLIKHHFQVFRLPPGTHEFYVRLLSNSHPLPVRIWKEGAHEVNSSHQRLGYGFYLGFMFFVLLSNLFFYVSLRNRIYLLYTVVVLIYICYAVAVMDGFILYFVPHIDLMFWYITIPTIGVTVQTIYALLFLEARKYVPGFTRIVWGVVGYFTVYMVGKYLLPLPVILAINTVNALISFFLMGLIGIKLGRKGNRLGYYFASAYIVYFLLVLLEATYIQTGNPSYFAELSHVAWATLIEAFMLSFLLSKRFEWERDETERSRVEAQRLLLEQTQENERLLQAQNETLEREVAERTKDINQKSLELQSSLDHLKATQDQLIQREKMASLGELTAGIAHEIQNPLNFVNNFSEVSTELVEELRTEENKDIANGLLTDITHNLQKITLHGHRAASIVRGMLEHTRQGAGLKQATDLSGLADEYLRLVYNGLIAKDKSIKVTLLTEYDDRLGKVDIVPQDIGRVLMNLFTNAFYAVQQQVKHVPATTTPSETPYQPTIWVSTRLVKNSLGQAEAELRVRDNGTGIPVALLSKVFQPFFTTKPTGQGTGLGLSLSYDIITKGHGGKITADTEEGQFTEITIRLPVTSP